MNKLINLIRSDLRQFNPYSSARDEAKQGKIWLNANELPWDHDDADIQINRYPEKQPAKLVEKISIIYGVQPEQLALFRGSDEAIDLLIRLFCRAEHDAIMVFPPTFGMYAVCAHLQGALVIEAPLKKAQDFQLDFNAICHNWTPAVKLIFVCSPNNPTANLMREADVLQLCQTFSGKSIIIVDEAYIEFSGNHSLAKYIAQYDNLVVLRTFSKAYGLAGARFGAVLAQPELIQWLKTIMPPYPLPSLAIHTIEKAIIPGRLQKTQTYITCIQQERDHLMTVLQTLPMIKKVWSSQANFILIEVSAIEKIKQACVHHGIILRYMHNKPQLEDCIRISVGSPEENKALITCLRGVAPS